MARTGYLAGALLAVAIAAAAITYVGRGTPAPRRRSGSDGRAGHASRKRHDHAVAGARPPAARRARQADPDLRDPDRRIAERRRVRVPRAARAERARLTGDVDSYARASEPSRKPSRSPPRIPSRGPARRRAVHDPRLHGGLLPRHRDLREDHSLSALAMRGDAELELGRYDDAASDYGRLADAQPEASTSLVRLSRLAFLRGDADEAARLAASAERAASNEGSFGASRSWYASYRGKLALDAGRYDEAARDYRRAVEAAPDYHVAVAGLASARAAQGRSADAIRLYERAVALVPEPGSLAALGDLYTLMGDERSGLGPVCDGRGDRDLAGREPPALRPPARHLLGGPRRGPRRGARDRGTRHRNTPRRVRLRRSRLGPVSHGPVRRGACPRATEPFPSARPTRGCGSTQA